MSVVSIVLLGIDSLIACIAISPLVRATSRIPLGALFGIADGLGFVVGSSIGWHPAPELTDVARSLLILGYGLYILLVATSTRWVAVRWPVWVLPWVLSLDNLSYGLATHSGVRSVLEQAGWQTLASGALACAGLSIGWALRRVHRRVADCVAGGALILCAGLLFLT
jgi:putative Mn2+ efflux pump MntP